jgi:hypothetical protein
MEMAAIINQYYDPFLSKYAGTVLPGHFKAINAIRSCRTPDSGELYVQCTDADCNHAQWRPLSCGHRNCPKCQNHQASQWIDRQQVKLLPVAYFLATFTLPYQLSSLTWHYQKIVFSIFFLCVSSTLKDFGLNPKNLGAAIGMTMVLHTHSRRLDFHPHIHVVVPGGGVDQHRRQWKKKRVRDYGFLHSNAKKLLSLVQLILHVAIKGIELRPRPVFKCPCCKSPMVILGFRQTAWKPG